MTIADYLVAFTVFAGVAGVAFGFLVTLYLSII